MWEKNEAAHFRGAMRSQSQINSMAVGPTFRPLIVHATQRVWVLKWTGVESILYCKLMHRRMDRENGRADVRFDFGGTEIALAWVDGCWNSISIWIGICFDRNSISPSLIELMWASSLERMHLGEDEAGKLLLHYEKSPINPFWVWQRESLFAIS